MATPTAFGAADAPDDVDDGRQDGGPGGRIDVDRWRREFPILDTCTYLVSHSLGRDAAAHARRTCSGSPTNGIAAACAPGTRAGGTSGARRATCSRRFSASRRTPSRCTRTSRWRRGSSARASGTTDPPPQDRHVGPRVPLEPLSVRRLPQVRRGDRRTCRRRTRCGSTPSGCSTRSTSRPCSCRCRSCSSGARTSRTCARSSRRRIASAPASMLDVYQAAGTVPMQLEAWGADFAVGGSVKWLCGGPGAGVSLRPAGSCGDARAGVRRLGVARRAVRVRHGPVRRAHARALPERDAQRPVALLGPGRATRSSREIGVHAIRAAIAAR